MINPLASHWLRVAVLLFVASPVVAAAVMVSSGIDFGFALALTLYMWALVCVILAAIALVGLLVRLVGRGVRALRR